MKKSLSVLLILFFLLQTVGCASAKAPAADSCSLADGLYEIDVSLSGGSGRASIDSPATLQVEGGKTVATIVWSSPYYDYMIVDGVKYEPVSSEGNSVFIIPVCTFDREMEVIADTVAMSVPHEIQYTLLFDSASLAKITDGEGT